MNAFSCGKLPSKIFANKKNNCPDSSYYFSQIDVIKKFQASRLDTVPNFESNSYNHKLDKEFVGAISYLDSITQLGSHVSLEYFFEYADTSDYNRDIRQFTQWYQQHCGKQ